MRVALKAALGVTVGLLIASEVPDDQGLVATAREQHVGARSEERTSCQKPIVHEFNQSHVLPSKRKLKKFFPFVHGFNITFFGHISDPEFPYFSIEVARQVTQPL